MPIEIFNFLSELYTYTIGIYNCSDVITLYISVNLLDFSQHTENANVLKEDENSV